MSQGVIAIPMWIPQIGYATGLVILLIAFVDEFVHVVRGNLPRYEKPAPQTAEEVVERVERGELDVLHDARRTSIACDLRAAARGLTWLCSRSRCFCCCCCALLAGGVWIAIALMACGFAGMMFVGGAVPPGAVLATTVWGNSASWTLAALPLFIWMGEILFRTRLSEEMFRGLAPWLNWHSRPADARERAGLRHLRLGVGLIGRDHGDGRQDRAAGIEEARLRREGEPRLARGRGHARHPHSAVDHDGDLRGAGQRLDHPGVPGGLPAGPAGDVPLLRIHRAVVAAQSGEDAAGGAVAVVPRKAAGSRRSSFR